MIAQGTAPTDVTPDQVQRVADDLAGFLKRYNISRKAAATAIGYSASVITEFIKGTYAGNVGQVAIDTDDWLTDEEKRREDHQGTHFVWTNVARHIEAVASFCIEKGKVGLIYGPETSGIGKTTALKAIAHELGPRRGTLVTLDKCDANPTGLLRKVLNGLRLQDNGSNAQRMDRVIEHLRGRKQHLLMIDQIHNLRFAKEDRPFYYLMDIYEATEHSAQLWCGTSDLVKYLQRQRDKTIDEPLAQVRSRIFPCIDLMESIGADGGGQPLYTVDQVRKMFAGYRLNLTTDAARWLCRLAHARDHGALRACVNVMDYAVFLAKVQKASTVDVPMLQRAAQSTLERASTVLRDMEEHTTDAATKVA